MGEQLIMNPINRVKLFLDVFTERLTIYGGGIAPMAVTTYEDDERRPMNVSVNGEPLLEHEFSRDDGLTLNWSLIKRRIAPSETVDTDGTIKPYRVLVTFEFDVPAELPLQVPDDDRVDNN